MKRWMYLGYAVACYAMFLGVFVYAIGFIGNLGTPTSLDADPSMPFLKSLMINLGLLSLFALQHSGMARQGFKRWWTRVVPVPLERATYVLMSNFAMIVLFAFWAPMGGSIWNLAGGGAAIGLYTLYVFGWMLVLVSTFLIDHFDLFGLKQAWDYFRGREYQPPRFHQPSLYRVVRHPLYVGWLIVAWATPTMTIAHLVFAIMVTAYILVAIQLEERDLVNFHGQAYKDYQRDVPMLVPGTRRAARKAAVVN